MQEKLENTLFLNASSIYYRNIFFSGRGSKIVDFETIQFMDGPYHVRLTRLPKMSFRAVYIYQNLQTNLCFLHIYYILVKYVVKSRYACTENQQIKTRNNLRVKLSLICDHVCIQKITYMNTYILNLVHTYLPIHLKQLMSLAIYIRINKFKTQSTFQT